LPRVTVKRRLGNGIDDAPTPTSGRWGRLREICGTTQR
jgi:hypothetical protein